MSKLLKNVRPQHVWLAGLALVGAGESWGAFDDEEGGTISEAFWDLPLVIQFFIIWCMGGTFVHFIKWLRVVVVKQAEGAK